MDVVRKIRDSVVGGEPEAPLPDLDIDIEEWLNWGEIDRGGGYRRDKKGMSWWLPAQELAVYESINNDPEMDDDESFWKWFDTFRVERRLKPTRAYGTWDYKGKKKDSDTYFRSMWKGFGFGSGYGSAETTELAMTLGFVQTLIQAVRTKPGRYDVSFATGDAYEAPVSYTEFGSKSIVVSPQAAKDKKISEDRRIRVTTGWALHESAHTEHTVDRWPVLLRPDPLKPPQVAAVLMNIAEDVRIESIMAKDFPGFADYFEDSRQYLWEIGGKKEDVGKMPADLGEMLSFVIRSIRWPDKVEPELASDDAKEEFTWWRDWHKEYMTLLRNPEIRTHMEKALNRLFAMFRPEMEEATKTWEKAEKEAGERESELKRLIEGLVESLKKSKGLPDPCPGDSKDRLSTAAGEEIRRKLDEEWEIEKREEHEPDGSSVSNYEILIRRPTLTDRHARGYEPDRGPMARRLRSAFVLRPAKPEYADRLLKSGDMDDEELWRWGAHDFRVFEQKIRETVPDTDITLLVDESGSMGGGAMPKARRLAQLMMDCLSTMNGVNLKIRGHTGQNGDFSSGIVIDKIWDPGDDPARVSLLHADAQNMDGYAIEWCVKELLEGRGDTQKILIVIADGEPYGHGYNGPTAEAHVREVTNKAERNGVFVIQLGVSEDLNIAAQRRMFKHFIPYTDDENLLRDLTKLMTKLF